MQNQKLMKVRKTVAILATAAMTAWMPINTFAAPAVYTTTSTVSQAQTQALKQMDLHAIFDASVYAAANSDVVAQVGNDPEALYNHFITQGANENRRFNANFSMADLKILMRGYKDQFGNDNLLYIAMLMQKIADKINEENPGKNITVADITADMINAQASDINEAVEEVIDEIKDEQAQLNNTVQQDDKKTVDNNNDQNNETVNRQLANSNVNNENNNGNNRRSQAPANNRDQALDNNRDQVPDNNSNNNQKKQQVAESENLKNLKSAFATLDEAYDALDDATNILIHYHTKVTDLQEEVKKKELTKQEAEEKLNKLYDEQTEATRLHVEAANRMHELQDSIDKMEFAVVDYEYYENQKKGATSMVTATQNKITTLQKAYDEKYDKSLAEAETAVKDMRQAYEDVLDFIAGENLNDADQALYDNYKLLDGYLAEYQILRAQAALADADDDNPIVVQIKEAMNSATFDYDTFVGAAADATAQWYGRVKEELEDAGLDIDSEAWNNALANNSLNTTGLNAFKTEATANEAIFDKLDTSIATMTQYSNDTSSNGKVAYNMGRATLTDMINEIEGMQEYTTQSEAINTAKQNIANTEREIEELNQALAEAVANADNAEMERIHSEINTKISDIDGYKGDLSTAEQAVNASLGGKTYHELCELNRMLDENTVDGSQWASIKDTASESGLDGIDRNIPALIDNAQLSSVALPEYNEQTHEYDWNTTKYYGPDAVETNTVDDTARTAVNDGISSMDTYIGTLTASLEQQVLTAESDYETQVEDAAKITAAENELTLAQEELDTWQDNIDTWVAENGTIDEVKDDIIEAKEELIEATANEQETREAEEQVNKAIIDAQDKQADVLHEYYDAKEELRETIPELGQAYRDREEVVDTVIEAEKNVVDAIDNCTDEEIQAEPEVAERVEEFYPLYYDERMYEENKNEDENDNNNKM